MQTLYSRVKSSEIHIWYRGLVLNLGFWGPVFCKWSRCQPVSAGERISDAEAKIKMVPSHEKPVQPVESDKSSFSINCPSQNAESSTSELLYDACLWHSGISHVGGLAEGSWEKPARRVMAQAWLHCFASVQVEKNLRLHQVNCALCYLSGGRKAPALAPSLIFLLQGGIWNSRH